MPEAQPLCRACVHHYITHDPGFPYGCRAMRFKSRRMPSLEVKKASGQPCLRFAPKLRQAPATAGSPAKVLRRGDHITP